MGKVVRLTGILLLLLSGLQITFAQEAAISAEQSKAVVAKEFGPTFKVNESFAPLSLDLDRDGQEDLVVVATGGSPLMGAGEYQYKVLDPYHSFFGFGNPKITLSFSTSETVPLQILIVHSWRKTPKAKFVLVNVPFQSLSASSMMMRKKPVAALLGKDSSNVEGAIFWDGRKYRWEPVGSGID